MMRLIGCLVIALSLSTGGAFAGTPAEGWNNSLKPLGKPGPVLSLASAGKTDYTIVLPAEPTTQEEKAASDLSKYLNEITGAAFPVIREGNEHKSVKTISVGRTRLLANAKIPEAGLDLGREGYAVAVKGDTLYFLGGSKRGPIYAVYALLEEDLGCRWYDSQAAPVIPHISELKLAPVPRHYVPVLNVRDPYYWNTFDGDWAIANRTTATWNGSVPEEWGGGNKHAANMVVHTYNALLPPEKYFEDHPEYYSELSGQRKPVQICLTNPDALRIVTARVLEVLKENPGSEYISVSPNDGEGYCQCAKCKAIDDAEGTRAGTLIRFVNGVAESVAKEYPGVKVTTLAYIDTLMPPKSVKPRDNVVIQLCTDRHAWRNPFLTVMETKLFQTAMKGWHDMGATTHIWDYTINYSHYLLPMPNMPIVAPNLRFYVEHGAGGVMFQGDSASPGAENAVMRSWIWAKQLWDPSRPTQDLMRDFIYGYYGAAAGPLWEYNRMLWRMWEDTYAAEKKSEIPASENPALPDIIRYLPTAPLLSRDYTESATRIFSEAEKLAANDPETMRRVKLAKLPVLYTKICQGVGYLDDRGEHVVGSMGNSASDETKAHHLGLVDELAEIVDREKITYFAEVPGGADAAKKIAKWREVLTRKLPEVAVVPISNTWKFKPDPDDVGVAEKWYSIETGDSDWSSVRTDTDEGWDTQGFPDYLGYGWYRNTVVVPEDFDKHKKLYMLFRGVDEDAEVYINGKKAFDHTCDSTGLPPEHIWITPFVFDARPFLSPGKESQVTVRVYNRLGMGGVHKPVYVISTDAEPDAETLALAARMAEKNSGLVQD